MAVAFTVSCSLRAPSPPRRRCVYTRQSARTDLPCHLVRRLLENGANSSFVHQLADDAVPAEEPLASPPHVTGLSAHSCCCATFWHRAATAMARPDGGDDARATAAALRDDTDQPAR